MDSPLDPSKPRSPEFLQALGRLIAESGESELIVNMLASIMVDSAAVSRVLLAGMDFRKKIDFVAALAAESWPDAQWLPTLTKVRSKCHDLYNRRNDYVHGLWNAGSSDDVRDLFRSSAKNGKYKLKVMATKIDDIHRVADAFKELTFELEDVLIALGDHIDPPANPGKLI